MLRLVAFRSAKVCCTTKVKDWRTSLVSQLAPSRSVLSRSERRPTDPWRSLRSKTRMAHPRASSTTANKLTTSECAYYVEAPLLKTSIRRSHFTTRKPVMKKLSLFAGDVLLSFVLFV